MIVNTKDMVGIPVETRSGERVGKVASFDLDQATGHLMSLHVKSRGLVHGLMADELLVPWTSILEMSLKKVVIQDGAVIAHQGSLATASPPVPHPTMMKETRLPDGQG